MRKRFIPIILSFLLVFCAIIPHIALADDAEQYRAAYEAALAEYEAIKQERDALEEKVNICNTVMQDNTAALAETDLLDNITISSESLHEAENQVIAAEQNLAEKEAYLQELYAVYEEMSAKLKEGEPRFLEWVKENYPEHTEDINLATQFIQRGIDEGYLTPGEWNDPTSIYCIKMSLQYMKEYQAFKEYLKDDEDLPVPMYLNNIDKTSFSMMACAQFNAGHAGKIEFDHLHGEDALPYYSIELLADNIIYPIHPYWSFYNNRLTPSGPQIITIPNTGDEIEEQTDSSEEQAPSKDEKEEQEEPPEEPMETKPPMNFTTWMEQLYAKYPNIEEDLPLIFALYNVYEKWVLEEWYLYDIGEQEGWGHFIGFLYGCQSGVGVQLTSAIDKWTTGVVAQNMRGDEDPFLFPYLEYERILDEYVQSLGLEEIINTFHQTEQSIEQAKEEILLLKYKEAYLQAAADKEAFLQQIANQEEEYLVKKQAYEEAKNAYEQYYPAVVEGLTVTAVDTFLTLNWNQIATKSAKYNIYRKTEDTDWVLLAQKRTNSFKDINVQSGQTYEYAVTSTNTLGESEKGQSVSAMFLSKPAVSVETEYSISRQKWTTNLRWGNVPGAQSYNIYILRHQEWVLIDNVRTQINDYSRYITEEDNAPYTFTVQAVSQNGVSAFSNVGVQCARFEIIPCTVLTNGKTYSMDEEGIKDLQTEEYIEQLRCGSTTNLIWQYNGPARKFAIFQQRNNGRISKVGTTTQKRFTATPSTSSSTRYFVVPIFDNVLPSFSS